MRFARRLDPVPEYLTARLNRLIAQRRAAGRDVISLGVGDPDLPPSVAAREALAAAVRRDDVAHYPTNRGLPELRQAVARFYANRFGVDIDPETEVVPLLGAKEGLAHLALAQLDPGDVALVADPGYPVYVGGPLIAGAEPYGLPLLPELGFQPDLTAVPAAVRDRANLLILGYPNNPTGAVVEDDLFERLVSYGVPVCHDNAYSEITFDGYVAPSFLATPGAREAGIEFLSLSKAFSLPGWRIAFAVGNAAMVGNLLRLKTNVDAGMFTALQYAAIALLDSDPADRAALAATYGRRRDLVCDALATAGLDVTRPRGGMYVWLPVPGGEPSLPFSERILDECDVVVSPGVAYGPSGEGFVRLALTQPEDRLAEAVERLIRCL
ncbi:MAG: LL-diaminopimelate aminotransferase [Gaiellaceae bacterium]|nr:LL-diaminopimelate aminotransferase [Gaiellaceae bacterium]